jgi:hypothetical protein
MAQAWADASLEQLRSASYHAIRAAAWQSILYEASCRLVPAEAEGGQARWSCRSAPPQGGSEAIPASILSEVEASRGILPVLSYTLLKDAAGASRPVAWGRGPMVLGGALVGLIVGCLIAGTWVRRPGQAA